MVLRTINAEICFAHNEDQRLLHSNILHVQKGHIALPAVYLLKYVLTKYHINKTSKTKFITILAKPFCVNHRFLM